LFFQAEDGIRYRNVTGVQTCALPILIFTISFLSDVCFSDICTLDTFSSRSFVVAELFSFCANCWTSSTVIRPSLPVPSTNSISTPSSLATFLVYGAALIRLGPLHFVDFVPVSGLPVAFE